MSYREKGSPSQDVVIHALIYPDLLPGPAFGWRSDGFIQAVDSLLLKPSSLKIGGVLANVASWITLRLGFQVGFEEALRALQPYYDGLALNFAGSKDGRVYSGKVEFSDSRIIPFVLEDEPGSYLFQVNVFTHKDDPELLKMELLSPEDRRIFEQRTQRTRQMLRLKGEKASAPAEEMGFFFNLITSRLGGEWAYSNPDVKAYLVSRISSHGMELWLGNGPPIPGEQPVTLWAG